MEESPKQLTKEAFEAQIKDAEEELAAINVEMIKLLDNGAEERFEELLAVVTEMSRRDPALPKEKEDELYNKYARLSKDEGIVAYRDCEERRFKQLEQLDNARDGLVYLKLEEIRLSEQQNTSVPAPPHGGIENSKLNSSPLPCFCLVDIFYALLGNGSIFIVCICVLLCRWLP